ncbi:SprT family protein [Macrococcoides canis]|uniref:SprT family protein n=1 Tax=Macrococcoides canis TaxID=1855823 RepID=UPI0010FC1D04|nr:SprT family protein [Macrococcus canis]QCT75540.1 SprT family protein [Macrococcus canis]
MENKALQSLVQRISLEYFNKPFRHQALFNNRLRTTGGRYMLQSHNIEINKKQFEAYGEEAIIDIIKHELVHYHLHIEGKGYKHRDRDFKQLAQQVGAPRYCSPLPDIRFKYRYICKKCNNEYPRKRRMSIHKYRCKCGGRLIEVINER